MPRPQMYVIDCRAGVAHKGCQEKGTRCLTPHSYLTLLVTLLWLINALRPTTMVSATDMSMPVSSSSSWGSDHKVEVVVRSGHESVDGYVAKDDQWFHLLSLSQRCVECYEVRPRVVAGRCVERWCRC